MCRILKVSSSGYLRLVAAPAFGPRPGRLRLGRSGAFAAGPNQLWVANLTYIRTGEGFLYLSVVVDAWSRRVVGWAMATHLRTQLVLDALDMALTQRRPGVVIHHSDHDSQYAAHGSTGPVTAERET